MAEILPRSALATSPVSIKNSAAVMIHAGTVVNIMLRMWSNRSMPTMDAAMPVVSDSGDILSPNSAPDTTAPATMDGLALNAAAMPINATPAVAQVVKPLPSVTPIIEHNTNADK